jgi:hypothetical protein
MSVGIPELSFLPIAKLNMFPDLSVIFMSKFARKHGMLMKMNVPPAAIVWQIVP